MIRIDVRVDGQGPFGQPAAMGGQLAPCVRVEQAKRYQADFERERGEDRPDS